jgi:glycosyltransferase involved in cell wall biosynthesis
VIDNVKSFIADFLLWAFFWLLVLGLVTIFKGRWERRSVLRKSPTDRLRPSNNPAFDGKRMVVALTAYNDAEAIEKVVPEFKAQKGVLEVIVVDNNSRDGTGAIARRLGAKVVQEPQQGYGYACVRGLHEALKISEADVIVLTEGDGTFSAEDLRKFEAYIDHVDMVVGSRTAPVLTHKHSQMDYFFSWGNMFLGALIRLRFLDFQFLGSVNLTDVGCTYRAIRREALERILPYLNVGGDHFSPHMILVALAHKLSIIEIPVTFWPRIGKSKGASRSLWKGLKVGLIMMWHIITYRPKTANPARQ